MKILKFYADWCSPCKTMTQVIESVKNKINVPVEEINIDSNESLTKEYSIRGIPALIILDDSGTEIKRRVGLMSAEEFLIFVGD